MATALVGALLVALPVTVAGRSVCPAPAEVVARLAELLPGDAAPGRADAVWLERNESRLRVVLVAPDGSLIGERELEAAGSCSELAGATAVVITAWVTDVHPEFVAALPPLPRAPAPLPVVAPAAARAAPTAPRVVTAPGAPPGGWDAGLALAASGAGSSIQPAAVAAFSWTSGRAGIGLRASAMVSGAHDETLSGGTVRWRRWPLLVGPQIRFAGSALLADLHAAGAAALLQIDGRGFGGEDLSHDALAFGFGWCARLTLRRRAPSPWVEAGASFWPRPETARQDPDGQSVALPRLELYVAVGVRLGR